jgi:hypothetical protein
LVWRRSTVLPVTVLYVLFTSLFAAHPLGEFSFIHGFVACVVAEMVCLVTL